MRIFRNQSYSSISKNIRDTYTAIDEDTNKTAKLTVQQPRTYYNEKDQDFDPETGQGHLFSGKHYPGVIQGLHASHDAHGLVSALLGHAHRVHNGDLTYDNSLSAYSIPVVVRALRKGLVKENPLLPQHILEASLEDAAKARQHFREGRQESAHFTSDESLEIRHDPFFGVLTQGTELPKSEVQLSQSHIRNVSGTSRFKPKKPVSDSQLTLPGM